MPDAAQLSEVLLRLADHFDEKRIPVGACGECEGWGQFLDSHRSNHQSGLYGTSAGSIVLAMSKRPITGPNAGVAKSLAHWWDHRSTDLQSGKWFAQNLRLAFYLLALRLSGVTALERHTAEVWDELQRRQLVTGLWGDWWLSGDDHDSRESVFTSSIVLLAATLNVHDTAAPDNIVSASTERLRERLPGNHARILYQIAACAALLHASREQSDRQVRQRMSRLFTAGSIDAAATDVYFFDYRVPQPPGQPPLYERDYFIVPTLALAVIGLLGVENNAQFRVFANKGAATLMGQFTGAVYVAGPGKRVSTKDQAWVALALALATKPWLTTTRVRVLAGTSIALRRELPANARWRGGFLMLEMMVLAIVAFIVTSDPTPFQGVAAAVGAAITERIRGRK